MNHDTTAVVVKKNKKLLIITRPEWRSDAGQIAFPGGHKEKDESVYAAAKREAREEIGEVQIENKPFLSFEHHVEKSPQGPHEHTVYCFHGRVAGRLEANDDAKDLLWMSPKEILNDKRSSGWVRRIVREMMR